MDNGQWTMDNEYFERLYDNEIIIVSAYPELRLNNSVRLSFNTFLRDTSMTECYACNLANGIENLIGGLIAETKLWRVEHCMGSLGVGTMIVKPKRHVLYVWELSKPEAEEMGLILKEASRVVKAITDCDQTYICLWSHAGWTPGHIHYVVQPAYNSQKGQFSNPGPALQMEMFAKKEPLVVPEVEAFCEKARTVFSLTNL